MAAKAVAIDPGASTWKVAEVKHTKNGLVLTRFGASNSAGLGQLGVSLQGAVAGLAGKDMTLRYTQVPPSPDWQLRNLMDLEIQDLASQSQGELAADYNLLPIVDEDSGMDTILMALARSEALESTSNAVSAAGGSVTGHVPNCIALYNAYLRCSAVDDEDAVVCLANIGHETMDIALVRGTDLLVARNMSGGAKIFDDAIAGAFNVSDRKAESLKKDLLDLDPQSRGRYASGQAEKVTMAAGGSGSMIVSAIQSSVMFCQSQTKLTGLQLDKVLITGGGARVRGIRGMLREALRCPVELFDPFEAVDVSQLPDEDLEQLQAMRNEAVVALGLAVGRIDEGVYALEILPEAVKRRQRFLQRTLYNIAAAAVAVILLVTSVGGLQEEQRVWADATRKAKRNLSRLRAVHDEADVLVKENTDKREIAAALSDKAIPMHGVLRTMRAVNETLPPEIWVTSIEVKKTSRIASRRQSTARPVVELKAAGLPIGGRSVDDAFREFTQKFRAHPLLAGAHVTPVDKGGEGRKDFEFTIDFMPEPAAKKD